MRVGGEYWFTRLWFDYNRFCWRVIQFYRKFGDENIGALPSTIQHTLRAVGRSETPGSFLLTGRAHIGQGSPMRTQPSSVALSCPELVQKSPSPSLTSMFCLLALLASLASAR